MRLPIARPVAAPPTFKDNRTPPGRIFAIDKPTFQGERVIIGLDPSLTHFGIATLLEGAQPTVDSQTTIVPKNKTGMPRIEDLLHGLRIAVEPQRCLSRRVIVVREDYAFSADSSSDSVLKELGGIIEWHLHKTWSLPLHRVGISSIKKFVAGKGDATKEEVMRAAYTKYGFSGDEHECDAFGAALLGLALANKYAALTPDQHTQILGLKDHSLFTPR